MTTVLCIDPGIWELAYVVIRKDQSQNTVLKWDVVSIPEKAGYPEARQHVNAREINAVMMAEMTLTACAALFPPQWVRHSIDLVRIEAQPRRIGGGGQVVELSMIMYSYFKMICMPESICCLRFPSVAMIGSQTKFSGGNFFGTLKAAFHDDSVRKETNKRKRKNPESYYRRKQYSVKLVQELLSEENCDLIVPENLRDLFDNRPKKDDMADCLLLAAVALRD
jgi:hypothetical protein